MKTFLIIVLVLLLAAVFINDVGRYARARYNLSETTDSITDQMSEYALGKTREAAATKAAELGQLDGIRVWQYDQNGQGVQVWTEVTVTDTWIIGPYAAWRAGKPLDTPYAVRDYGAAVYR